MAGTLNGVTGTSLDYFFASSGSNANDGTMAAPYQDLRAIQGLITLAPGDRLLFREGDTIEHANNYLVDQVVGSQFAPVVIGCYTQGMGYNPFPAKKPVVNRLGTNRLGSFTASSVFGAAGRELYFLPGTWTTGLFEDKRRLYCCGRDGKGNNPLRLVDPQDGGTYDGIYNFWYGTLNAVDFVGTGIYWRPRSEVSKSAEEIITGNSAMLGPAAGSANIVFENFESSNIAHVIYMNSTTGSFNNMTFRRLRLHNTRTPISIGIGANSGGILAEELDLFNNEEAFTLNANGVGVYFDGVTVRKCKLYQSNVYQEGYLYSGSVDGEGLAFQNTINLIVEENDIYDTGWGFYPQPWYAENTGSTAIIQWNDNASPVHDIYIRNNRIYRAQAGIVPTVPIDGEYNIEIYNNYLEDCVMFGIKTNTRGVRSTIRDNVLVDCNRPLWNSNPTITARTFNNKVFTRKRGKMEAWNTSYRTEIRDLYAGQHRRHF